MRNLYSKLNSSPKVASKTPNYHDITRSITILCGIDNILKIFLDIPTFGLPGNVHGILSIPHNIVMDLNNVILVDGPNPMEANHDKPIKDMSIIDLLSRW